MLKTILLYFIFLVVLLIGIILAIWLKSIHRKARKEKTYKQKKQLTSIIQEEEENICK